MTRMTAAVRVVEPEGITAALGIRDAASNPFYAAMQPRHAIRRVLARHLEAASHMAEGYTRTRAGNTRRRRAPGGTGRTSKRWTSR